MFHSIQSPGASVFEPLRSAKAFETSEGIATWKDFSGQSASSCSTRSSPTVGQRKADSVSGSAVGKNPNMACVQVTSNNRGFVTGRLDWKGRPLEDVELVLQEVKPGYIVVGEVCLGPDVFGRICWKLASVNGANELSLGNIMKGDQLILEGPSWTLDGLSSRQVVPSSTPAKSFQPGAPKVPPEPFLDSEPVAAPGDGADDNGQVVPARRIARPAPVVPRLDLANLKGKRLPAAKAPAPAAAAPETGSWLQSLSVTGASRSGAYCGPQTGNVVCTDFWRCV
eukprot:gb/GFBE01035516.1/.p1 GENE.gb/GFBE01035516.1/~~gb/GFBE01035516.1/.p1  ORF type:complete len:282 (+),score=44.40 gb/GFBE01035516.1/:1-846(+)